MARKNTYGGYIVGWWNWFDDAPQDYEITPDLQESASGWANVTSSASQWTTIDDNGEQQTIISKPLKSGLDTVYKLEDYTDYKFSNDQKTTALKNSVVNEISSIPDKFSELTNGINTNYLIYGAGAIGLYFLLGKKRR